MSRQNSTNNMSNSPSMDSLLESLVNLYTLEQNNRQQPNSPRPASNYPLSFNIQRPRQTSPSSPSRPHQSSVIPTPTPSPIHNRRHNQNSSASQNNLNQQFSAYLSIIQTLRDIGNQYNNNMREYNTNIRQIFNMINEIREDIRLRESMIERIQRENNENQRQTQRNHSNVHSGLFSHQPSSFLPSGFGSRPNQNRSYVNQPTNNNMFDILFQTISLPQHMENVVVRPTPEQIRNATRSIIYSPNNVNISNSSCPITLEPFEEQQMLTQIIYCGHVFSQDGINRWFEANVRCPICRYDIRNYNARCRQCRRPLQEYGTRCTYCDEAGNRQSTPEQTSQPAEQNEQRDSDNEDEHNNEDDDEVLDASSNPFQVIMNYEIRTPDFTFNSHDISFNTRL